jgi:hypothetical protein
LAINPVTFSFNDAAATILDATSNAETGLADGDCLLAILLRGDFPQGEISSQAAYFLADRNDRVAIYAWHQLRQGSLWQGGGEHAPKPKEDSAVYLHRLFSKDLQYDVASEFLRVIVNHLNFLVGTEHGAPLVDRYDHRGRHEGGADVGISVEIYLA